MARIEDILLKIAERARKRDVTANAESAEDDASGFPNKARSASEDLKGTSLLDETVQQGTVDSQRADIAVLVALPNPELDQVLRTLGSEWRKEGREGIVFNTTALQMGERSLSVVATVQNDMGMVPAAILATKAIRAWHPRLLAMTGICAGVKEKVNLGDIVVGKHLFDYGSGKLKDGKLLPDYHPIPMDDSLCGYAIDHASNKSVLDSIRKEWPLDTGKPDTDLHAHVGAMASGAAVVSDDTVVEGIQKHKRSLTAVDMESYGVARAAHSAGSSPTPFIIVKGVQDFADATKGDQFREYAAFVSARFLRTFIETYWDHIMKRDAQLTRGWSLR